jgi:hypothetical protein
MLPMIGLVLVVMGWAVQLYYVLKGERTIQPLLLVLYGAGVTMLAIDGFMTWANTGALLNLVVVFILALILWKMLAKKKS